MNVVPAMTIVSPALAPDGFVPPSEFFVKPNEAPEILNTEFSDEPAASACRLNVALFPTEEVLVTVNDELASISAFSSSQTCAFVTPVIRIFLGLLYVPGSSSSVNVFPSIVILCPSTDPAVAVPPAEGLTNDDINGEFSEWVSEFADVPTVVDVTVTQSDRDWETYYN